MGEAAEELGATFDDGVENVQETTEQTGDAPVVPAEATPEAKEETAEAQVKEEDEAAQAIRDAAFKAREAKREAAAEKERREELERKLQQYEAPVRPDIPPPPDPYDQDFQQRVAHRDALIAQAARWDAQQAYVQQQAQADAQARWQAEQDKLRATVTAYSGTADKLGITASELSQAGQAVAQFGIHDDLAQHILTDEQGPSITVYLSKNPLEMDKISNMSPIKAAAYIESHVKPKAVKPPPQLAPEPVESLKGSGVPENESHMKGVTME
jgi:hypothetical protein